MCSKDPLGSRDLLIAAESCRAVSLFFVDRLNVGPEWQTRRPHIPDSECRNDGSTVF